MSMMSYEKFGDHELDPESVKLLPQIFCISSSCVILGTVDTRSGGPIHVGMADPGNLDTIDTISRRFNNRRIVSVPLKPHDVTRALNLAYGLATPDPASLAQDVVRPQGEDETMLELDTTPGDLAAREATRVRIAQSPEPTGRMRHLEPVSLVEESKSSIIPIVNNLLLDAIRKNATDVHIENERREVTIRYKLDGLLHKVKTTIHKDNIEEVINRLKVMADLDISEKRGPQDGRVLLRTLLNGQDHDVPFRISILPGPYGEEIVLRVLDKSMAPVSLELLGFTNQDLRAYRQMVTNPQGMILVTGPTGSGKTTTLYATLKEINTPHNKILSAEDPIEYNLEGVNQKQISAKFDFADMARAFLRHDPDILLIGEIRDEDTADVACKAAQTGHLILSTLHTNDSVSAISRLHVLGLDYNLIGSSLLGVLSQRLVRRICPDCKTVQQPHAEDLELFRDQLTADVFYHGGGCRKCNHTGFRGRIGIFELFMIDDEVQRMIYEERHLDDIEQSAMAKGMTPLVLDGIRKVEQEYTTLEELRRVIPMRQIIKQHKAIQSTLRQMTKKPLAT
ncbi:MAG: type II/IV secretion system protein [Deltaproteobacteria bacterium]|nr:type II/IV secretion system protein [Deltaproteobacteria bacterium]